LKFVANTKLISEALESIQGKGKYLTSSGFTNNSMGLYVYMKLEGRSLNLWNGDSTFGMNITLEVLGGEDGEFICNTKTILPYLKKFGEVTLFEGDDFLKLSSDTKTASVARVVNHPNMEVLTRLNTMLEHITYVEEPEELPAFGSSSYEGAFTLEQSVFSDCISSCELAQHGAYKLDYNGTSVEFSTGATIQNQFKEILSPNNNIGEPATLEFSGPLHKFFPKNSKINFYVKDEFPLLLVSEDRKLVKAPFSAGN
tara:strand:- start:390 stop:1157 length:768 start_codon:yes stop_codon:yes gene_type:complete